MRIGGKLHWMHVNSTPWLTHLAWHPKRGKKAMDAIGIWPRFAGRGMHDRFASYDQYPCQHSVCGAHLLRDCLYVSEQEQQEWALDMHDLLLQMCAATHEWRQRGASCVPALERQEWLVRYARGPGRRLCRTTPTRTRDGPQTRWSAQAESGQESLR